MTAEQAFPGATGVTLLDVYDWPTADGLRGGSASRFVTVAAGGIGCW